MTAKALIIGITGQDGAYLAKLLLEKGYRVYGAYRDRTDLNPWRLLALGIADDVEMLPLELLDYSTLERAIARIRPDEIYNLAARSFIGTSFEQPLIIGDVDALGAARVLEAIRNVLPGVRFYQASSSEMFGRAEGEVQTERTSFRPRNPYGTAKLYAHWMTVNYRESFGLHACSGILYNHESPMRGLEYVTRKITATLAMIRCGLTDVLELGDIDAKRDWGFAGDYVKGIWSMLQQPHGDDFVLATGESHSVREFLIRAAECTGFELDWQGRGRQETAFDRKSGRLLFRVNPKYCRSTEEGSLIGEAEKARRVMGWKPEVKFDGLIEMMVEADIRRAEKGRILY